MIDIGRILCAVDFSDGSRRALAYALRIAHWYRASVTVLHVAPVAVPVTPIGEPALTGLVPRSPEELEALRVDLQSFVEAERAEGVDLDLAVVEGHAWREIAERARDLDASLLVLGRHGRSRGGRRLLMGSLAEKLSRVSPCAVLTVPGGGADGMRIGRPPFTRILWPTDFSAASTRALDWALSLALEADASLVSLHVIEDPGENAPSFDSAAGAAYRGVYREWCRQQLYDAVPVSAREWCEVRDVVVAGLAAEAILEAVVDCDCDLIVMGVADRRGLGDRIFGSTPEHVLRAATCPVLTTHTERK